MNSVCKRGLGRSGYRSGERFGPDCGMQRNPHRPNPLLPTIVVAPDPAVKDVAAARWPGFTHTNWRRSFLLGGMWV